jgi:hypothetical protein
MENYIKQLIEDLRTTRLEIAKLNEVKSITDPEDEIVMGDFSSIEKYIYGEQIPIEIITGIDANLLPPADKLTHDQMAILADELEKLLELKYFALEFPENLPMHIRYPLIRKFWNEMHVEMEFGTSHIEFCQYEPDNCPYPDYCQCKDFQNSDDEEYNTDHDNGGKEEEG